MPIGEICNREVVIVQSDTTVQEAAQLMRQHHVGALVVVDESSGKRKPVGVVTDRDLVVEVMAPQLDAAVITVGDIMLQDLGTILEDSGVFEAIQFMRAKAVRRLPVVDSHGALIGIVALDDLLALLAEELSELSGLVSREQKRESRSRR
ncbi:MAG TPA: CBS domain-containing protein [Gallionella sp.]|nr:CBS domain-containing protein [Gallionella sp.]